MIHFSFNISWPWFKPIKELQRDYFCETWSITKNKSIEVQLSKSGKSLIGVSFDWATRCDHAGVMFELNLFRHFFIINFYDSRHWNYEEDRYVNYNNPKEVEKYW